MEIQKLVKQVKREAKANPVRSAVLAGVTLLAIYFWTPLMMKWFGGPKVVPVAPTLAATITEPSGTVASPTPHRETFEWQHFLQLVQHDESMSSATLPALQHDPFGEHEAEQPLAEQDKEVSTEEAIPAPVIAFDDLQLRLESTLISPRGAVVVISGELVTWKNEPANNNQRFTINHKGHEIQLFLIAVRHKQVDLTYGNETHQLSTMDDSQLSGSVERN